MFGSGIICRAASLRDGDRIRAMQAKAMRTLGRDFYTDGQIDAFLALVSTLDDALIEEGHYFLAETERGQVVATGGWSQLLPGYATKSVALAEPAGAADLATVRAVYVEPLLRRRGLGTAIMRTIEWDALANGITRLDLTATLSGVPLYRSLGYRETRHTALELGEVAFACVRMERAIGARPAARDEPLESLRSG